jgi:hypothetical protein
MDNLFEQNKHRINRIDKLVKAHKELKIRYIELEKNYTELQNDYQRLKIAKAFGQSENDKKDAFRKISSLIAGIDKCLKLLNE